MACALVDGEVGNELGVMFSTGGNNFVLKKVAPDEAAGAGTGWEPAFEESAGACATVPAGRSTATPKTKVMVELRIHCILRLDYYCRRVVRYAPPCAGPHFERRRLRHDLR